MHVTVDHLTLAYDGHTLFEDVSFEVSSGQTVCVAGPSGCGKTSLFAAMLGFTVPRQGGITIGNRVVNEKTIWPIRHEIAYVAQEPNLGQGTVLECIRRPFSYKVNVHLQCQTPQVHSQFERLKLPLKLLDKQVSDLSGGEKQRVAFIIALLLDRPLLLLDEPTSALDKANTRIFKAVLDDLEKTILYISHDAVFEDITDRTIVLSSAGDRRDE